MHALVLLPLRLELLARLNGGLEILLQLLVLLGEVLELCLGVGHGLLLVCRKAVLSKGVIKNKEILWPEQ